MEGEIATGIQVISNHFVFHPDALSEYDEAAEYHFRKASAEVALRFIDEVEATILEIVQEPSRWRLVDEPNIPWFVLKKFPFLICYSWEPKSGLVTIHAVMHSSRKPGYWSYRADSN